MYPLEGVRVLDMSRVLAGPFAARMLSDLGADVVKLEPPEGDITRLWGAQVNGIRGYFNQQNVGKRGVCIDLHAAGAADVVKRLAARADVLVENFRPGVMERLGLGWDVLREASPRLVMLSISGFGQVGPESGRAAYAPIIHAESGIVDRQARWSRARPADVAVSMADTNAALHGLAAVLSALLMRERTGRGERVDMAMIDAMLATDDHLHYALEDAEDEAPMPSEVWDATGGPIMISGDFRHVWRQLQQVCGVDDPTPVGASLDDKIRHRREAAARFFVSFPSRGDLVDALDRMNLAWGDVRSSRDVGTSPTVQARATLIRVDDRGGGTRPVVQAPYRFSHAQSGVRSGAPHRGEHNREVLMDWLRADDEEIERLVRGGVLLAEELL